MESFKLTQLGKLKSIVLMLFASQAALAQTPDTLESQVDSTETHIVIDGKKIKITIYDAGKIDTTMTLRLEQALREAEVAIEEAEDALGRSHRDQRVRVERRIEVSESLEEMMEEMEEALEEMGEEHERLLEMEEEELEEMLEELEDVEEIIHEEMHHFHLGDRDDDKPKVVETRWNVMDIGFNDWVMSSGELGVPEEYSEMALDQGRGVNFHWGIFQQGVNISAAGRLRLVYGVGIEYNNYRFVEDIDIVPGGDMITYSVNDERNYRKNKLVTQYATIPLMINFKSNPRNEGKSFNFGVGAQFGYLFGSHQKQKWNEDGQKEKLKKRGDYHVEEYRYGYVAQIGYGDFNLYAKYYPTPVFQKDKGPEVYSASVGLVIMPF